MHILVTGGMGFIGSNFIRYHLKHYPQDEVINLDLLSYAANQLSLADITQLNYHFYQGSINDLTLVQEIVQQHQISLIINFAGESDVDRSLTKSDVFVQTNVAGVNNLINVALKENIPRFIQISTDEVYGSLPALEFAAEDAPLNPSSPYSATKASAELLLLAAKKSYQLGINIIRSANNYGPRQYQEKLIPKAIIAFLKGNEIPLFGKGLETRDWLYVNDNIRAIETVIHFGKIGEIYNVGTQKELSNFAVLQAIAKNLSGDSSLIRFTRQRPGHDQRYGVQTAKIKELGWQPEVDFGLGIKKTVTWYQTNRSWWDDKNYR